ncbi:MAG: adenylate/guanylate cyclase domain-containing protein [Alphaproteobacteria bacterium]
MAEARVERRLAAILAADIAGYSRLMGSDEEGTLASLWAVRREVIDPSIAEHRGRIVKTAGDGMLVEFQSVLDALRCAAHVQRELAERNKHVAAERRMEFRVGIHQGDIVVDDGDIFGDGVNIAARLEGVAEPGGICVSARVQEDAAGRLDLNFEDLGEQALKNIARRVRVYRVTLPPVSELPDITGSGSGAGEPVEQVGGIAASRSAVSVRADRPAIAVLPFQNMSGDPELEFFADGLVEEIITALSQIRWLFVTARNSVFAYKGRSVDVKQVGRELGVRHVLEGSVRKSGERVRITAQLIDAATGNHLWAERYDREVADIFALQDEITGRVVGGIEPELYHAEARRTGDLPAERLDPWGCITRALSLLARSTPAGVAEAEALCRRAVAMAPDHAGAHSLLAWALVRGTTWSGRAREALAEASAEVQTALSLDDRDAWGHFTNGLVLWRGRRLAEALRAFRCALELNPNFALAHGYLAHLWADLGEYDKAIAGARQAFSLSPRDRLVELRTRIAIAHATFGAGRYAEAVAWTRQLTERFPEHPWGPVVLTAAAALLGDRRTAAEALAMTRRFRLNFSPAFLCEMMCIAGEMRNRVLDGLGLAGAPGG